MLKTLTFAVLHFSIAFGVTYAITGSLVLGGAIALIEPAINTLGFHFHEMAWRRWEDMRAGVPGRPPASATR